MNDQDRYRLITDATGSATLPIEVDAPIAYPAEATRFVVHVYAADNQEYALKGVPTSPCRRQSQHFYRRGIFIEQVIGRLSAMLDAPIPPVSLLQLSDEVIRYSTWLRCLTPGIVHGVKWISNVSKITNLDDAVVDSNNPGNRSRMAALAVLLGWISNFQPDFQYLIENNSRGWVWSVDHGLLAHHVPIWPDVQHDDTWREYELAPHARFMQVLKDNQYDEPHDIRELREAAQRLANVSDEQIASAVAAPPESWQVGVTKRIELMRYLQHRRDALAEQCLR
jgi:hypothetical protein